jgi:hypothetical protein
MLKTYNIYSYISQIQTYVIVYIKFYIDLKSLCTIHMWVTKFLNNDKIIIHTVQVLMQ